MDRSCVITLIKHDQTQDENGVWRKSSTSREVFAQVNSVTRSEFFSGGRSGLNPEYMFTMFFGDYEGEKEVVYNGFHYSVYRVYQGRSDTIEVYVERKGGTNGGS
jgi:hypothetical protein